jgi:hypothetical protein
MSSTIASKTNEAMATSIQSVVVRTPPTKQQLVAVRKIRQQQLNHITKDKYLTTRIKRAKKMLTTTKKKRTSTTTTLDGDNSDTDHNTTKKTQHKKTPSTHKLVIYDNVQTTNHGNGLLKFGAVQFMNTGRTLFTTNYIDSYILITNVDFTPYIRMAPLDIRRAINSRWRYGVHVSYGMLKSINRSTLHMRCVGGQILAYKYTECSVEGNEAVYYGFIPSCEDDHTLLRIADTHTESWLTATANWPRKLYIYLEYAGLCRSCPTNDNVDEQNDGDGADDEKPPCTRWTACLSDGKTYKTYCLKTFPWASVYIMMGECLGESSTSTTATSEPHHNYENDRMERDCAVCAQCYECSRKSVFCRKHRVCRHKQKTVIYDGSITHQTNKYLSNIDGSQKPPDDMQQKQQSLIGATKLKACPRYKPQS